MKLMQVPWLRKGKGESPQDGGCILQVIDWIDRCEWTDDPPCVHPVLASLAIRVNDCTSDEQRQKLLALAPRLMGTGDSVGDPEVDIGLALCAVEYVLPLVEGDRTAKIAVAAARAWFNTGGMEKTFRPLHASLLVKTCELPSNSYEYNVFSAIRELVFAAECEPYYFVSVCSHAVSAIHFADMDRFDFLVAMLDEYDRLTGRGKVKEIDWSPVCAVMA